MTTGVSDASAPGRIREATRADLLSVFRIERASFAQPWPYDAFEHFLGLPGFLVADSGGTAVATGGERANGGAGGENGVVGYVIGDVVPNGGRGIGHIKDLAVHPDHRGRGLGATLLRRGLTALSGQGATSVKLEVRAGNGAAISLYRAFGFEHQRTVRRYYRNGEDALVMVRGNGIRSG
ncbi:ribosomal-protein-alanine N-acetyltransferase RimI [Halobacteriales archaeon QS_8_65_32]|nr:MAG: ribosomal-protein-alanine N-acetyltransferase RimI [Halobacteriales archaeon QS_8_65_32]